MKKQAPQPTALICLFVFLLTLGCQKKQEPEPPFSLSSFSPGQGVAGTVVSLQGEGFGATPADNTVKFNGIVATVSAATANQLTVSAPTGVTTGKITVEAAGRIVTSAADFVVIDEPFITTFSPAQAEEGDLVTVQGGGFKKGTVTVKFNGSTATTVTVTTDSQLSALVPEGATTGKISVAGNGKTGTSATDFTLSVPLSAKATVTKLTGIVAFAGSGADGVRMAYVSNTLYITGPSQKAVYRMDLTTLGVAPFQSIADNPVGIAAATDQIFFGDTGNGYYYTYRFDKLSKSSTDLARSRPFSLKAANPATKYNYICANFDNELIGIANSTAGGNTSSSFSTTVVNGQLKGTPDQANAHLATNSKSVFVFCNQALWKLQPDNTLKLIAGTAGQKGYVDGAGSAARFQDGGYARGNTIAVDESDNVYVNDYGSGCIRKVDASGNVTTVVGNKKFFGQTGATKSGRGHRMAFRFDQFDLALAPDGTLYVIANNDVSSTTLRFAVYKVVIDK